MSRKTRKLIWSAPLMAVLAVAGALAIFAALAPNEAAAHETAMHGPPGPVMGLTANPATDDTNTPKPEGRNAITLTWAMPSDAAGDPAESYRIDISTDTRVWTNLEAEYTDASAEAHCPAGSADNLRCYTSTELKPATRYNYRVFAENEFGISPVSVEPTYDFAFTGLVEDPSRVGTLSASTTYEDKIVLNWSAPADDGGTDILWYCLAVATTTADFADTLTDATCQLATGATMEANVPGFDDGGDFTENAVIVVPGSSVRYEHTGLDDPPTITLYYRAYAVTDPDGMRNTIGNRRLASAASNIATGRTVKPKREFDDPLAVPSAVRNLRAVAFGTNPDGDGDFAGATLNLYWNKPTNFPAAATVAPAARANWRVEVQEWGLNDDDEQAWVTITGTGDAQDLTATPVAPTVPPQYVISDANSLVGTEPGTGTYRVRYVIDATPEEDEDSVDSGDVPGEWAEIKVLERRGTRLPLTTELGDALNGLPFISALDNDNAAVGLRFRHGSNPQTEIDLSWDLDDSEDAAVKRLPTGYVIDVSEDGGITWEPVRNATRPADLGATTYHRERKVIPGKRYTYRVFPEQAHAFGLPKMIHASSEGAQVPNPVDGLTVTADGQTALVLNWNRVTDNGGHDIIGYLVQVSRDVDNDGVNDNKKGDTGATGADWMSVGTSASTVDVTDDDYKPWTVSPGTTMYRYDPDDVTETTVDESLSAGNLRWFRVFAITVENDGNPATGGQRINLDNGALIPVPSTELSPVQLDIDSADEESGRTDLLPDPGRSDPTVPPPAPVNLTAEVASDSNLLSESDRGVLLLWNEPPGGAVINTYVIQRSVNGAAFETIDTIVWAGMSDSGERTSYTDESTPDIDGGEVRMYRVGSRSAAAGAPVWSTEVMYPAAHGDHVPDAPMAVMATAMGATQITVTWTTPSDNGGSDITGYMVQSKYGDGEWMDVDPAHTGMDMMYMDTGLMSGTTYYYRVLAMNAAGNSEWSDGMAMAMTEEAADTALGDAMGLVGAIGSESNMIELTWTAGDNADIHWVFGIHTSNDIDSLIWTKADASDSHTVDMTGKPRGSYTFFVIAGQTDDAGDREWSNWTPGTVTY